MSYRTQEQKELDELYETTMVLIEELGVRLAKLQVAVMKLGKPETKRLIEGTGKEFIPAPGVSVNMPSPEDIIKCCADTYSQRYEEVIGSRRYRELVDLRFISLRLILQLYGKKTFSLKNLGRIFGNRDHTTIMSAIEEADELFFTSSEFKQKYLICEMKLKERFNYKLNNQ